MDIDWQELAKYLNAQVEVADELLFRKNDTESAINILEDAMNHFEEVISGSGE